MGNDLPIAPHATTSFRSVLQPFRCQEPFPGSEAVDAPWEISDFS